MSKIGYKKLLSIMHGDQEKKNIVAGHVNLLTFTKNMIQSFPLGLIITHHIYLFTKG